MSGSAFRRLLAQHASLSHVKYINLKGNDLGPTGAIALAHACVTRPAKSLLYSQTPDKVRHLVSLRLEGNHIGDTGVKVLCEALAHCRHLETLDLASNNIGSKGGTAIGMLLGKSPKLTEVDFSRNCIRGGGAAALAFGLAKSRSLLWCDISMNSFNNQAARTLARSLKKNAVLTHLDISLCKFKVADIKMIGSALKSNRTLRGIHALGNEGTVDSRGFLIPKRKPLHTQRLHLPNRMLPLHPSHATSKIKYRMGSSCWVCGQWTSHKFHWTVGKSEGAMLTRRQLGILREMFRRYLRYPFNKEDSDDESGSENYVRGKPNPEIVSLDPKCLKQLFGELKLNVSQERIDELFCLFDDGNGQVEFPELVAMVSRAMFLQDASTGAVPARVLLVTDFGGTYVNEEPVEMLYDSSSRTFNVHIMVPPTRVSYFFVVNGQPRTAADQTMESPFPESTEARAFAYKIKTDSMRKAIFPDEKALALRNFVHCPPPSIVNLKSFPAATLSDWEKPRKPRKPIEIKAKGKETAWTLKNSVFAGYKDETDALMEKCFETDWMRTRSKMRRFIKDADELDAVKDIFEEHYVDLCNAFKYALSACGEEGPFSLQIMPGLSEFNESTKIIDSPGSGVSLSDLDTIFIATNYTEKKVKGNPDRALVRYQWMEYIARCAIAKYAKPPLPGEEPLSPPLALDVLMETNILPLAKTIDSLPLRHDFLWNSDADRVYRDFLEDLDKLFKKFARSIHPPAMVGMPLALSLSEFLNLVNEVKIAKKLPKDIDRAENGSQGQKMDSMLGSKAQKKGNKGNGLDNAMTTEMIKIFVASKMVYKDPLKERHQKELTRVEYLEAVGRIAEFRIKLTNGLEGHQSNGSANPSETSPKRSPAKGRKQKRKKKKKGKKGKKKRHKKKSGKMKSKNIANVVATVNLLPRPGDDKAKLDTDGGEDTENNDAFRPAVNKDDQDAFLEALTETLGDIRRYLTKPARSAASKNPIDFLEKCSIFEECGENSELKRALATVMTHHIYEDGETIASEGTSADCLWVVLSFYNKSKDQDDNDKIHTTVEDECPDCYVSLSGDGGGEIARIHSAGTFGHVGLSVESLKLEHTLTGTAVGSVETLALKRKDYAELINNGIIPHSVSEKIESKAKEDIDERSMRMSFRDEEDYD